MDTERCAYFCCTADYFLAQVSLCPARFDSNDVGRSILFGSLYRHARHTELYGDDGFDDPGIDADRTCGSGVFVGSRRSGAPFYIGLVGGLA